MNQICKSVLAAAVISAIACHDVSGPPGMPANYVLRNISGRSLPTFFWTDSPESPTILGSALFLDGAGNATVVEVQQPTTGGSVTYTTNYRYVIDGDAVEFEIECPPNALCIRPPTGVFHGSHLLLDMSGGQGVAVYDYELVIGD